MCALFILRRQRSSTKKEAEISRQTKLHELGLRASGSNNVISCSYLADQPHQMLQSQSVTATVNANKKP